jgi:hypothetical protein
MSRKVVPIAAGPLLAVGTVAAVSAPHFRGGGPVRSGFDGSLFAKVGDLFGGPPARLDNNGDGVIERARFEAFSKESADYWARRVIGRFDADNDGGVIRDDFNRFARAHIAGLDAGDGGWIADADLPPMMCGRGLLK